MHKKEAKKANFNTKFTYKEQLQQRHSPKSDKWLKYTKPASKLSKQDMYLEDFESLPLAHSVLLSGVVWPLAKAAQLWDLESLGELLQRLEVHQIERSARKLNCFSQNGFHHRRRWTLNREKT
jgi:hypothetical protein